MAWRSWPGSAWCRGRLEPVAQHAFCHVGRGSSHGLSACRQGRGRLVPLRHFLKPTPGSCPGVAAGHHVPGRWMLVRRARAPGHSCCRLTPPPWLQQGDVQKWLRIQEPGEPGLATKPLPASRPGTQHSHIGAGQPPPTAQGCMAEMWQELAVWPPGRSRGGAGRSHGP